MYCVASVMMKGNTFSQAYTAPLNADSATASAMPTRIVTRKLLPPNHSRFTSAITMPTVETR